MQDQRDEDQRLEVRAEIEQRKAQVGIGAEHEQEPEDLCRAVAKRLAREHDTDDEQDRGQCDRDELVRQQALADEQEGEGLQVRDDEAAALVEHVVQLVVRDRQAIDHRLRCRALAEFLAVEEHVGASEHEQGARGDEQRDQKGQRSFRHEGRAG